MDGAAQCRAAQGRLSLGFMLRAALLLCCGLLLTAVPGRADRFAARLLDQSDGLGNLQVNALARAADGPLWVATENGVYRYDGSSFQSFGRQEGLEDPNVFSLLIDRAGTLWAGTHNGLFWFEGQSFHKLPALNGPPRVGINSMLTETPQGVLALSTTRGLYTFTRQGPPSSWKLVPAWLMNPKLPKLEDVDGVLTDQAGLLWFGCQATLCRANLSTGVLSPRTALPQGIPNDFYVSLYQTRMGQFWARGRKHLLTWRAGDARVTDQSALFPAGAMNTVYRRFTEDPWGRLLTPTAKGFATWDGTRWSETDDFSKGPIGGASDILCDQEGVVWIGTQGSGLLVSRGYPEWESFGMEQGVANANVLSIARDSSSRMWFATSLGADVLPPGGDRLLPTALNKEKDAGQITSLTPDGGNGLWAAGLQGRLYHLAVDGRIDRRISFDAYIERIRMGRGGRLWVATTSGLFALDTGAAKLLPAPVPQLKTRSIGDVALGADGSVWIASDHGLDRLLHGSVTHITVAGLSGTLRTLMLAPDGTLWVAGQMPMLLHLRVEGDRGVVLAAYTRPQLASDLIEFVQPDARGRVWIGTDRGLEVLRDGSWYRIDEKNGLISNICIINAFWADPDGSIWVGTAQGVSHLKDPDALLARRPFAARIERAQYGGRLLRGLQHASWNNAALAVHFSTSSLRDSEAMLYHATLSGAAIDTRSTRASTLLLERLPPGQYRLSVTAEDTTRHLFSAPASLSFMLTPPWWRTRAAAVLLILLLVGIVFLLWQWRHLALLARQRRLEQQVEERTRALEAMATRDGLTGLLNRRAVLDALKSELQRLRRKQGQLCVALIDLDHFKAINDTYGHLVGDAVLLEAAQRFQRSVRASDLVGRYGGEEFLVVFRDASKELGLQRCELICRALDNTPIEHDGCSLHVSCSIGLAWGCWSEDEGMALLSLADHALYKAKAQGRNRVEAAEQAAQ